MMLKNFSTTTKLFGGLVLLVIVIMVIAISASGNSSQTNQHPHFINDNASADNKVEALKTMTADLLAVQTKNQRLTQTITNLKASNQKTMRSLKASLHTEMRKALKQLKSENKQSRASFEASVKAKQQRTNDDQESLSAYAIQGKNQNTRKSIGFSWHTSTSKQSDLSNSLTPSNQKVHHQANALSLLGFNHDKSNNTTNSTHKNIKPIFTIPVNATLTGATLMTPLVGRVPIDGKLPSPYHFKLVLSSQNLTANGYPLPGIKGAVMSGVASGDMLGQCTRGQIHSMTFIFNDGTINTTQANGSGSLGYISSQTGNPCLAGTFHSNAAVFLGAQMGLAGAEGYANAVTSSQYLKSVTPNGNTISALIGSANKAGVGAGMSAASQAAQTWWNQRVQNSFDYVYTPNVNPKTGKPMKVVVNITKAIDINKSSNARKVNYEYQNQNNHSQLD